MGARYILLFKFEALLNNGTTGRDADGFDVRSFMFVRFDAAVLIVAVDCCNVADVEEDEDDDDTAADC